MREWKIGKRGTRMLIEMCGALFAGMAAVIAYDSNRFIRQDYHIHSDKFRKKADILLLSDLHNKSYGKGNKKLLAEINRIRPDFIVVAGDMMTSDGEKSSYEVPLKLLRHLAEKYPVYYGMGNHEYRVKVYRKVYEDMFVRYKRELENCGVRFLENEKVYLPEYNIEICGLEIERRYYKRWRRTAMEKGYVDRLLGKAKKDCYELLIGHNPDYFKEYADWGADLTVSGHVHGGVVRFPFLGGMISPSMRIFPKYDGGMFEENGKTMVLSRGLGMHTIPVRVFNPGELVVIHCGNDVLG